MSEVRRHPRRRFIILLAISGLLLMALVLIWILYRPGVMASLFAGRLGDMLGGEVEYEEAVWLDSGELEITGLRLQAPGLQGPAGQIAMVDSLLLDLSVAGILGGEVVRSMEVHGATLRLAEDRVNPWRYNINQLTPEEGGDGGGSLPSVLVSGLRLETGTFDSTVKESWTLVGSGLFEGAAQASDVDDFEFELDEILPDADARQIRLKGGLDTSTGVVSIAITGVSLDDELKSIIPALGVRDVWEALELRGSLDLIEATLQAGHQPQVELSLKDVDLVLPESYIPEDQWVHYHEGRITPIDGDPRLHVDRGIIRFTGDSFELDDLDGYVIAEKNDDGVSPVPYVINLTVSELPDLSSIDDADVDIASLLGRAPFNLRLQTEDFQFEQGGSADLPIDVADIFVLFGVEVCTVDIDLNFWRDSASSSTGEEQPVLFKGDLLIEDAAGAFERFPYPLRNLKASISFDDRMVDLLDLAADGSGDSRIQMSGKVSSVAAPSVNIRLQATDLPLDAALIEAMPAEATSMMQSLFGRHGALSTVETKGDASSHELVGLDLDISRPEGRDQYTSLSGLITFDQLSITWDGFPYPIELGQGRMEWKGDELQIENATGDGPVLVQTAGGGTGIFGGVIYLPEEDQAASGRLEISVTDDLITPELISGLEVISPGEAALLRSLGLIGRVDYEGRVAVIPGSPMEYDLSLSLEDGDVTPTDDLAGILDLPGPVWPSGFQLHDVEASLQVTPEAIRIDSLGGHNAMTTLELEGEIISSPVEDIQVSLVVDALPMSERIAVVFPENERPTLLDIWEGWNGRGSISLLLTLDSPENGGLQGTISDLWIEAAGGDTCRLAAGSLSFDDMEVLLDELELEFRPEGRRPDEAWSMFVDGELERGQFGRDVVSIRTDRGRFGSVVLSEVVANLMSSTNGDIWRGLHADGWFRGVFQLDTEREDIWSLALEPESVNMHHEGEIVEAVFESAVVEINGSGQASGRVMGQSNFGEFDVDAWALRNGVPRVEIDFDFDGQLGAPAARAILPDALGDVLGELNWDDGRGTRIENGRLIIELDESGKAEGLEVKGDVTLSDAAMDLGVTIDEIDASLSGSYSVSGDGPARLEVGFDSPGVRAVERSVVDITGSMSLSEDGMRLLLPDLRGTIADGAISLAASLSVDSDNPFRSSEDDDWDLELLIANADLLRLFGGEPEDRVDEASLTGDPDSAIDVAPSSEADSVEGRVYMSMYMGGRFDRPESRRGRGHVRIVDAVLGDVPVIVGIQQILHLTVPTLSRPDFVDIDYYVSGNSIILNDILIESSVGEFSVFRLEGNGAYDWAKAEIAAELVPRGGVMVVDELIGLVQDHLYAVGISGPIEDPEVDLVPFPGLQ